MMHTMWLRLLNTSSSRLVWVIMSGKGGYHLIDTVWSGAESSCKTLINVAVNAYRCSHPHSSNLLRVLITRYCLMILRPSLRRSFYSLQPNQLSIQIDLWPHLMGTTVAFNAKNFRLDFSNFSKDVGTESHQQVSRFHNRNCFMKTSHHSLLSNECKLSDEGHSIVQRSLFMSWYDLKLIILELILQNTMVMTLC